ncbi:hypothetical protein [Thalassospira sp.]|uniref:hypothetical protein n=1 Tax=Thalassospira sp. TaxID=1912094 RepID=UPI002735B575|nr:hypothetical protein [Thalassospira sp.]MDP2697263.1 hypothetical protein [Thalassospira sp.]
MTVNMLRNALIAATMIATVGTVFVSAQAQQFRTLQDVEDHLRAFEDVRVHGFASRDQFLAIIDKTLGLDRITDAPSLFARLPRSPFAVTGRTGGNDAIPCQIFIPDALSPERGTDIFSALMQGWLGERLHYASSPDIAYGWLMRHEVRHCTPDHINEDPATERAHEIDADLFALNALPDTARREDLIADILAFRMITATLFASPSHMTGLALKHTLAPDGDAPLPDAADEIMAFGTARQLVFDHSRTITTAPRPSNHDVIRAMNDLADPGHPDHQAASPLVREILVDLDHAVAHFAPDLHQSSTAP